MTKGIIIFAQNNDYVDYVKISCASAGYARKYLSGFDEICLITDESSLDENRKLVDCYFDRTIVIPKSTDSTMRKYRDTIKNVEGAPFINKSRGDVYSLSPYDETLVIDCDYFIMTNQLDGVWGSRNDFMITKDFTDISQTKTSNTARLNDISIDMYWATVIYFRKCEFSSNLFKLVNHIKNNYRYYYNLYKCDVALYRNDHTFSIALHILNGEVNAIVPNLPFNKLVNSFDTDQILRVDGPDNIVMITAKNRTVRNIVRLQRSDLHIMNKRSITKHLDSFFENGITL